MIKTDRKFTKLRDVGRLKLPILTAHEWPCADCGGELVLIIDGGNTVYRCINHHSQGCQGIAYAHADGTPMGIPIDQAGRNLRRLLHELIDPLWKMQRDQKAAREKIYNFMYNQMGPIWIQPPKREGYLMKEFHIGYMMHADLEWAIEIAQSELRKEFG